MARRKKRWSYNVGERGVNWVRAFEHTSGKLYLEWMEDVENADGAVETKRRRARIQGEQTREEAEKRADTLSERFLDMAGEGALTMTTMFRTYTREVTPQKGKAKQGHDRRAVRVWTAFFAAQEEKRRHPDRHPSSLDRTDWDRFRVWRSEGRIPGWQPVRSRMVQYDLKFLVAVLNWAVGHEGLLTQSPWRAELRRVQGWEMPVERNPDRPSLEDDILEELASRVRNWQFRLALLIERYTTRRNNQVRQLWWSDLDFEAETMRWREEIEKSGRGNVTPMPAEVAEALRAVPVRGIGDTPVFPSATDPRKPTPRNTFSTWLRRAKDRWLAELPEDERPALRRRLNRVGFHGAKRTAVRDPKFRALPPKIQEELAATSYETLRKTYDEVTIEDMKEARRRAGFGS